jgi:acyl-CoA reductase-like NAD-dependent aldehyde dehydrogenase
VLNVVTGSGEEAGTALVEHPRVRKVSFTGDVATGQAIRAAAAPHLKQVTLELGGSDPMIVWKDADLRKAVDGAMRGRFYNAGQICTAVKRLFLDESIAGLFLDELEKRIAKLAVGNGLDAGVEIGPLQNQTRIDAIDAMVEDVRERGQGRIQTGGRRLTGGTYDRGFFYAPTLITDVDPDAVVLRDEVFGPVLPAVTFDDLDEAIRLANSTRYGLGASIWTRDLGVVKKVFSGVQAGIVWANRHLTVPPEVPFGGVKESGMGRENGVAALHEWTESKTLMINW